MTVVNVDDAGNLMVVALANFEGLRTVAYYTLKNLYQPGDTIHTTYVEDSAGEGDASWHVHHPWLEQAVAGHTVSQSGV